MEQILQKVKNIVFDLGGVLLDIDPERTVKAFQTLGLTNVIKPGGWGYQQEVFLQMEEGKLTDNEFRDGVRKLLPTPVSDAEIDRAWCAMLIDFPADRVALLRQLKSKYNLYLFSNTNSIHVSFFHKLFHQKFGFSMSDLFVKDYYSNEINSRKPALESFQIVLNDAALNPPETLFIDDSKDNVEGAEQAGMHAFHLNGDISLQQLFGTL
jgi:putative hydrolase of the HAD superfamily